MIWCAINSSAHMSRQQQTYFFCFSKRLANLFFPQKFQNKRRSIGNWGLDTAQMGLQIGAVRFWKRKRVREKYKKKSAWPTLAAAEVSKFHNRKKKHIKRLEIIAVWLLPGLPITLVSRLRTWKFPRKLPKEISVEWSRNAAAPPPQPQLKAKSINRRKSTGYGAQTSQ